MNLERRTLEALRNELWFEDLVMAEARSYHDGGNCKLCKPSMAEAWAEGSDAGYQKALQEGPYENYEAPQNPYREAS